MSISSMVKLGVDEEASRRKMTLGLHTMVEPQALRVELPSAPPSGEAAQKSFADALAVIAAFIPSEVIGAYITLVGLFEPRTFGWKWALFGIGILLIFVITALHLATKSKKAAVAFDMKLFLLLCAFAILAFVAWTAALPDTPFLALSPVATKAGAAAVIVLAAIMPQAAKVFGISTS